MAIFSWLFSKNGAKSANDEDDSEQDEDKIKIGQHYKKLIPQAEWLQETIINAKNIAEW